MADKTKIEWADATINAVNGCSVVSPGCTNCYAMRAGGRNLPGHPSTGLTMPSKAGHVWTDEVRLNEEQLLQPLRWKQPRRIFWNAHGDLFHPAVPDEWVDRVFAVCALTPQHTHMILTKRPERMRLYMESVDNGDGERLEGFRSALVEGTAQSIWHDRTGDRTVDEWLAVHLPLRNVWLGTSVEDQRRADERVPHLLATPAAVRFLSCEPLLGPVNLDAWLDPGNTCQGCDDGEGYGNRCARSDIPLDEQCPWKRAVQVVTEHGPFAQDGEPASITHEVRRLDWVIVGGESGPGARPMHPDWARSLRDQCAAAGVPFHFKQWGEWLPWSQTCSDGSNNLRSFGKDPARFQFLDHAIISRVGKALAGRLLDGVEHNGLPA